MQQLKILMIAPTPYFADRGCHVRIYEEARALRARGHDVRIVTYHIGRDMPAIPTERIVSIPWYRKLSAGPSWHKLYLDILLFFKTWQVARGFRPHLLHAHLHEGAFLGIFLKRILKIPLLFDYQGSLSGEMVDHNFLKKGSLFYEVFAGLENFIHRHSDRIIVSSVQSEELLRENWAIPAAKLARVIDAVDTDTIRSGDAGQLKSSLGLPPDRAIVVYTGVLNHYQGIDLLLEAAQILVSRQVAVHFLIIGFPEDKYQSRAKQLGLGDYFSFVGKVPYEEIPAYLTIADLAVSPKISTTEANQKLFNYMACGLPAVVFESKVNREILGDHGVYARFADPADLARTIAELCSDSGRRKELAVRVRNAAVEFHSWTSRALDIERLYLEIAGHE